VAVVTKGALLSTENSATTKEHMMSTQTFWKVAKIIFWFHFISLVLGITIAVIVGP